MHACVPLIKYSTGSFVTNCIAGSYEVNCKAAMLTIYCMQLVA